MFGWFLKWAGSLLSLPDSIAGEAEDSVKVDMVSTKRGLEARAVFSFPCVTLGCGGKVFGLEVLCGFFPPTGTSSFSILRTPVKEAPACRRCGLRTVPVEKINEAIREETFWVASGHHEEGVQIPQEQENQGGFLSGKDIAAPRGSDFF